MGSITIAKIVVFLCSAAVLAEGALVVNAPPNQCNQTDHNGVVNWYPLYARWPSTAPGACIGYYCRAPNDIYVDGCNDVPPDCSGNNVCYQTGLYKQPFPYCCVQWSCSPDYVCTDQEYHTHIHRY